MLKKFTPLILVLCLGSASSYAQKSILLEHESFTPQQSDWTYDPSEVVNGKIYRLIQSPILKLNKTRAGIHTMEYVPKNSFLSSIDIDKLEEAKYFLNDGESFVLKIKPEWKMSSLLKQSEIPDHIKNGSEVWVWIRFYRNVEDEFIREVLNDVDVDHSKTQSIHKLYAVSIPINELQNWASKPYVSYIQEGDGPAKTVNFYTRSSHKIDYVQNPNVMSTTFTGDGVTLSVGDNGIAQHLDFNDRILQNATTNLGDHGDHVTGTAAGAGIIHPLLKGAAPEADLMIYDWGANLTNANSDYDAFGVRVLTGSISIGFGCAVTNPYNQLAYNTDFLPVSRPTMTSVWAAGNEGFQTCSPVGAPWGSLPEGFQRAKNQIIVANCRRNNVINGSSSRGPTPDGRLKPDITGLGTSVLSTTDLPPNSYNVKSGTSMATPGVSGGITTLYQAYRHFNNGNDPLASTVKAVLLNTADDFGNPGPDFTFGYGKVNFYKAHKAIEDSKIIVDTISSGINTHVISVPSGNVTEVRVLLCWTDTMGNTGSARPLVNDLDLVVKQNGTTYQPWVLDPTWNVANLNANAVRARDSLNNVEQVTFTTVGSGNITIEVDGNNVLTSHQAYSISYEIVMDSMLIINPAGGESYQPGTQITASWVAGNTGTGFAMEYSIDSGATWINSNQNIGSTIREQTLNLPLTYTRNALVRLSRSGDTVIIPKTFAIMGEVLNLQAVSSCPDSTLTLAWDSVSGVSQYVIYKYGTGTMDSIGMTTDTFFVANSSDYLSSDEWYSVAPMLGNQIGVRSDAYNKPKGLFNCNLSDDLEIITMSSPTQYGMPDCYPTGSVPLRINIKNHGSNDAFNFVVHYRLNGGNTVSDTIKDTVAAGAVLIYEFAGSSINMTPGNAYNFDFLMDYHLDRNPLNDTLLATSSLLNTMQFNVPYLNTFENFSPCSTTSNCGQTTCTLSDGWNNLSNSGIDDHDFRVISGPTPSSGTGPNQDYLPGTPTGQYLYLEASSGCDSAVAILVSPCFFIDTSVSQPVIEYAYHMMGSNMGKLNVDLITDQGVILNVVPEISGHQDSIWLVNQIDLQAYKGNLISIRFRAKTGNSYESDLALDYFNLFDQSVTPPTADFGFFIFNHRMYWRQFQFSG